MADRVMAKTLDWEEIRAFLVRRRFLRGSEFDEETYDAICDTRTRELSGTLMRELSVFIAGYLRAKS